MESVDIHTLLAHEDFVRKLARRLVGSEHGAEDVVQKTWLAALTHPPRHPERVLGWLSTVVRNHVWRSQEREKTRRSREERAATSERVLSTTEILEREATRKMVVQSVLTLEDPYRSTVLLRYFQGWPPRQISRHQETSVETVKTRLKRGISMLREKLDAGHGGDRKAWCSGMVSLFTLEPAASVATSLSLASGAILMSLTMKMSVLVFACASVFVAWYALSSGEKSEKSVRVDSASAGASLGRDLVTLPDGGDLRTRAQEERIEETTTARVGGPATAALLPVATGIVGRILDEEGNPVSGARVKALEDRPRSAGRLTPPRTEFAEVDTLSRSDGSYQLIVPEMVPMMIRAVDEAHVPGIVRRCFAGEVHDITLLTGACLRVEVRAAEVLVPIENAVVSVVAIEDLPVSVGFRDETVTDLAGVASLDLPKGSFHVSLHAGTFARALRRVESDGRTEMLLSVELEAEAIVLGEVIDAASGLPIPSASVTVGRFGQTTKTDEQGRFRLGGFGASEVTASPIVVVAPGYSPDVVYVTLPRPGHTENLRFSLTRGILVRGRVTDEGLFPLSNALVRFEGSFSTNPYTAEFVGGKVSTGVDGRFEILSIHPEGTYRLGASLSGFGMTALSFGPFGKGVETHDIGDVVLSAEGTLSGVVRRNDEGASISGYPDMVTLDWLDDRSGDSQELIPISLDLVESPGYFLFSGLSAGTYRLALLPWDVKGGHEDDPIAIIMVTVRSGEVRDDLVLAPGNVVRGRLVTADGKGIARKSMTLRAEDGGPSMTTETGKSGSFEFGVSSEGPFTLVYTDYGLDYLDTQLTDVFSRDEAYFMTLTERRTEFSVSGRIVTSDGLAVTDVYVQFIVAATGRRLSGRVAIPDEQGEFQMVNLDPVAYHLEIIDFADRYRPARLSNVTPGEGTVEFSLHERD